MWVRIPPGVPQHHQGYHRGYPHEPASVPMPESIVEATSAADYQVFGALIRDYIDWLRARWAERPGLIDDIASHQGLSLIHISEPTRRTPISYAVFCLK